MKGCEIMETELKDKGENDYTLCTGCQATTFEDSGVCLECQRGGLLAACGGLIVYACENGSDASGDRAEIIEQAEKAIAAATKCGDSSDEPANDDLHDNAENEDAQAASVTQFVPPISRRLAIRPATTLPSRPGKVLSCHGT